MLPLLRNRYQIIQHLGNGILGDVYLAQDIDFPVIHGQGSDQYLVNHCGEYLSEYLAEVIKNHNNLFSDSLDKQQLQNIATSLCVIHAWDLSNQSTTDIERQVSLYQDLCKTNQLPINYRHGLRASLPKILATFVTEDHYYLVQEFQLDFNYLNLVPYQKTEPVLPIKRPLNQSITQYWTEINSGKISRQKLLQYSAYLLAGGIGFSIAIIIQWWREQSQLITKLVLPKNLLPEIQLPTLPIDPVVRGDDFFSESIISNNRKISLEMIRIPAGTFLMGSPSFESGRKTHESPEVVIGLPAFYIGKFAITQQQWQSIMGYNPAHFRTDALAPVENISWHEAQDFCKKLSRKTGQIYRLPTESEWEYACRAATRNQPKTAFSFGNNTAQLGDYGWFKDNSSGQSQSVGQKLPNGWGLHDMHGGVWEWCEDVWHDHLKDIPPDGSPRLNGSDLGRRTRRGGSWSNEPALCRSASREWHGAGDRYNDIGLRVALSVPNHFGNSGTADGMAER